MKNQFELEQQIMDCWGVIDDIKILTEHVLEDEDANTDSISNALIGIENLYNLKFEKLFRTFESTLEPVKSAPAEDVWIVGNMSEWITGNTYPVAWDERMNHLVPGHFVDGDWVDNDGNSLTK